MTKILQDSQFLKNWEIMGTENQYNTLLAILTVGNNNETDL